MFSLIILKSKKQWHLNKKNHRSKGPAIEWKSGEKWWIKNGLMHREGNLPAIENKIGENEYWIEDQKYILQENGTKEFIDFHGNLHRDSGLPAIEYSNGDREWWLFGKRHRLDGPAVIIGDKKFCFEFGRFKCSL